MTNRERLSPKDPDDDAWYAADESNNLSSGDTISSVQVAATTGGITTSTPQIDGQTVKTLVSGGTDGELATITFRYSTDNSEQFDVTVSFMVRSSTT